MIFPQTYRRQRWDFEGCGEISRAPLAALACHKGDATQQQSSTQVGSQTGGVSINGGISVGGGGAPGRNGPAAVGGGSVTIQTDANGPAAFAALQSALDAAAAENQTTAQIATAALAALPANTSGASLSGLQKWAAVLSIAPRRENRIRKRALAGAKKSEIRKWCARRELNP